MKKTILISLVIALALTFVSCPEEEEDGEKGDLQKWIAVTNSTFTANILGIAYGIADDESVGRFVAVGLSGKMAYSDNGTSWTAVSNSTFGTSVIRAIAYGNNRFVAGGGSGKMAYSDDNGVTWTAVANSTFPATYTSGSSTFTYYINGIAYGNNRFVAVGYDGKMAYSANGTNWTAVSNSTFGTSNIYGIAYENNRFFAGGSQGKMAYANWTGE